MYNLIKVSSSNEYDGRLSPIYKEYILDNAEDITDITDECAPGSLAYTADLSDVWQLSPSGTWVSLT